jgi:hypothetical protein
MNPWLSVEHHSERGRCEKPRSAHQIVSFRAKIEKNASFEARKTPSSAAGGSKICANGTLYLVDIPRFYITPPFKNTPLGSQDPDSLRFYITMVKVGYSSIVVYSSSI